jgi:hypothetical protein
MLIGGNIQRCCRLLATKLTDLQRQYLHKRIAEEHAQLEELEKVASRGNASACNTPGRAYPTGVAPAQNASTFQGTGLVGDTDGEVGIYRSDVGSGAGRGASLP